MRKEEKQARIFIPFEKNAQKLFPHKSMLDVTKELNKILEEFIYGKPKNKIIEEILYGKKKR